VYDRHWGSVFSESVLPVIDRLVLRDLPERARILDLCCGTGQLADLLTKRGFRVTGIDGSKEMVALARKNAPRAEFRVADVRSFRLPPDYDAALSTYDSLNHVMTLEELESVFRNVRAALKDGGGFLFDLNMEEGYRTRWRGESAIVEDDHVVAYRSSYSPEVREGRMEFTIFRRAANRGWKRTDLALTQRCYGEVDVRSSLERAGFDVVRVFDGGRDLEPFRNVGRAFFLARKPVIPATGH
jgi:SAM-dependent methyltransferase